MFIWTQGTAAQNVTLDIGKAQLEIGSIATPFEYRSYQQELQLCMRYYEEMGNSIVSEPFAVGVNQTTTTNDSLLVYKARKRTTPSISFSAANTFRILDTGARTCSAIAAQDISPICSTILVTMAASTVGYCGLLTDNGSANSSIKVDSEL